MDQKKGQTSHLRDTISALDSAVDQWNSITNNPEVAQAPHLGSNIGKMQKDTKDLLTKLRDQIDAFASDDVHGGDATPSNSANEKHL